MAALFERLCEHVAVAGGQCQGHAVQRLGDATAARHRVGRFVAAHCTHRCARCAPHRIIKAAVVATLKLDECFTIRVRPGDTDRMHDRLCPTIGKTHFVGAGHAFNRFGGPDFVGAGQGE